jgi:tRNA(Ile2) C34 agmatinyltransferase TiaS
MDAWDIARKLAPVYSVRVDEKHIARVVESYDRWISQRATCPDCANFSLQKGRDQYGCFACGSIWNVNWRKDRRVKRTIIERYVNPQFAFLGETAPDTN